MTMHPTEEIRVLQEHVEFLNAEIERLRSALNKFVAATRVIDPIKICRARDIARAALGGE